MSRQNDIKRLIFFHTRRLQTFEEKRIIAGPDSPENVLIEIDDIKSKITNLQAELEDLDKGNIKTPPPEIEGLYYQTKQAFNEFRQILNDLSTEINYIATKAQAKAAQLLEHTKQYFWKLEEAWNDLDTQSESAEEGLKILQSNLSVAKSNLHILILRRNYRRRFSLLEEKLVNQQLTLTEEQLQTTLEPHLRQAGEQIQSLESKDNLTSHDEKLLTLCRRNLELSQQILTGKRPYAPLNLLNELIDLEQTLEEIDNKIIQL